ncbi:MAG: GntR family transcriptional regulator [Verrucomicrobia bacterium]|nr:GntR family transcriptional regulator [Verrucomicrobiota bacterium]
MIKLDEQSKTPLHVQIERGLRDLLRHPKHAHGAVLPPETELARQLNVSRGTVRLAMNRLVQEGLLERRPRIGTRVRRTPIDMHLEAWDSFTGEMAGRGLRIGWLRALVKLVDPPANVRAALDRDGNGQLWQLIRLAGNGVQGPTALSVSWLAPIISLDALDPLRDRLYTYLEDHCGVLSLRSAEKISAVAASAKLARRLRVTRGAPLLRRERLVYDRRDRPVEHNVEWYRPDRFVLSVELRRAD